MTRHLFFVLVESGPCQQCGRDAGEHSIEGICPKRGSYQHHPDIPEPCYRGTEQYAFVDQDAPHGRGEVAAA